MSQIRYQIDIIIIVVVTINIIIIIIIITLDEQIYTFAEFWLWAHLTLVFPAVRWCCIPGVCDGHDHDGHDHHHHHDHDYDHEVDYDDYEGEDNTWHLYSLLSDGAFLVMVMIMIMIVIKIIIMTMKLMMMIMRVIMITLDTHTPGCYMALHFWWSWWWIYSKSNCFSFLWHLMSISVMMEYVLKLWLWRGQGLTLCWDPILPSTQFSELRFDLCRSPSKWDG